MKKIKYFVCPVCRERKQRGQLVKAQDGSFKGMVFKVCKKATCRDTAKWHITL